MKKLIITTLAVAGISGAAFAQGYVQWNATPGNDIVSTTNGATYSSLSTALGGGAANNTPGTPATGISSASSTANQYYYELLQSTVDTATPTSLTDLSANWFVAGSGYIMQNSTPAHQAPVGAQVSSADSIAYSGSGNVQLMLVGWSADLGTTWGGAGGVLSEINGWNSTYTPSTSQLYFLGLSTVANLAGISQSAVVGSVIWNTGTYAGSFIQNPTSAPMVLSELQAGAVVITPEPATMALAAIGGASLLFLRRRK